MYIVERIDAPHSPRGPLLKHEPRIYSMSAGSPRESPSHRWFGGGGGDGGVAGYLVLVSGGSGWW